MRNPFARILFSANSYPRAGDASEAFFRRWLIVPFDRAIDPQERILNLSGLLSQPAELSGLLNKALDVLPAMQRRGGFLINETTRLTSHEFQSMTDPLAAWLHQHTILSADAFVSRKDLLIAYGADCKANDRPAPTSKMFCSSVRRLRPTVGDGQRTVCGQVQWVFLGLKMAGLASRDSSDSHHFPQISLGNSHKDEGEEGTRIESLYRAGRVNGVNGMVEFEEIDLEN